MVSPSGKGGGPGGSASFTKGKKLAHLNALVRLWEDKGTGKDELSPSEVEDVRRCIMVW